MTYSFFTNILVFFSCSLFFQSDQEASTRLATLHAVIAADTLTNLKGPSKYDISRMRTEFQQIAKETKLQLNMLELQDRSLSRKSILGWLKNTKIQSNDVVIFYFTGHGFRTEHSDSLWPMLFLAPSRELFDSTRIIKSLQKTPQRLCVILYDCCNNPSRKSMVLVPKNLLQVPKRYISVNSGYRKLFLESSGICIASGSVPGEVSWATPKGGIFTSAFLESLKKETEEEFPSWDSLFDRTERTCSFFQQPQYVLKLKDKPIVRQKNHSKDVALYLNR